MIVAELALTALWKDRFFLLANTAIMVGVLVPLLVLLGVKNGVYSALIGELMADPATLQIDTAGNASFSDADIDPLRQWPEIAFLTPKIRGQFDYMNVRAKDGPRIRPALIVPSGTGDPTLPEGALIAAGKVAVSAQLARQLDLETGAELQLISQAENRPRQLVLPATVSAVLPDEAAAGAVILAPFETLDLIEAFYESYALPDHGITHGRDLTERVPAYEGIRVYARDLDGLAELQSRIETELSIRTTARTRDVEALLGLGRNLNLAMSLTAALATIGLGAALVLAFWSDVARKRGVLATIALLGVPSLQLALFPVVQALATAMLSLVLAFAATAMVGPLARRLFGQGLPEDAALLIIAPVQAAFIALAVLALTACAAAVAAWSVQRLDPAVVLRDMP